VLNFYSGWSKVLGILYTFLDPVKKGIVVGFGVLRTSGTAAASFG
jgi:hypothetical protein